MSFFELASERYSERYFDPRPVEQDATIVATTMMYEAVEVGVHSVWLRGFDSQQVAEVFDLPKNHIPVMMFAMGYPSDKTKPSPWHFQRKPIEDTVTKL